MLHAWNEGMVSLRDPKRSAPFIGLDAAITAAGLSDPQPPEQTRVTIGRSELLAAPGRKP
jgi:serine/threonine-protein kinase HipA